MQNDQLQRETIIIGTNQGPLNYITIIKNLQPLSVKAFRFNIPEICIFNSGDVEMFISQKRTNLIGINKTLKNIPFFKLKSLLPKGDCICKYTDQNVQILSNTEITLLLNKRRNEPIWKDILYLQVQHWTDQRILYVSDLDDQSSLFKRAYVEIGIMIKDIVSASSQYITDEGEDIYERSLSHLQLCQYYTYKIVHFLEKVHHLKITHGIFRWSIESNRNCNFIDCQNVSSKPVTIEEVKPSKQQQALQLIDSINDDVVKQYTAILSIEYQKKRHEMGFNEKQFAINKDQESEKVYNEIHENSKIQFNQLFKDTDSYNKYEGNITNNQGNLLNSLKWRLKSQNIRTRKRIPSAVCESPKILPIRPMTQQIRTRAQSSYKSKSKLKYNTLPYLLQY